MVINNSKLFFDQIMSIKSSNNEICAIVKWLNSHSFLTEDAERYFYSTGSLPNTMLKKIETAIRCYSRNIDKINPKHPLIEIIREITRLDTLLESSVSVKNTQLMNQLELIGFKVIEIEKLNISTTKEVFLMKSKNSNNFVLLFLYTILGKIHLPQFFPEKCISVQMFGEIIFSELIGAERIITSIFPGKLGYANSEYSPLNNVIIQPYKKKYKPLSNIIHSAHTRRIGIRKYAEVIAHMHQSSYGISKHFNNILSASKFAKIKLLLNQYQEYIFLKNHNEFHYWINNESWLFNKISKSTIYKSNYVNSDSELFKIFLELTHRSKERIIMGGCLSNMDLLPRNILVNPDNFFDYKICDFELVSFTDLSYDLGLAIYSIIVQALRDNYFEDIHFLIKIFMDKYESFIDNIDNIMNERIDLNTYYKDSFMYAGFFLYFVIQSDYTDKYSKYRSFVQELSFDYIYNK